MKRFRRIWYYNGCPPAKKGGERSERALASVALAEEGGCSWSSKVISMRLPKNNHPMPLAFPLLRRRGAFFS